MFKTKNRYAGMTLVELMLGLALSVFILASLGSLYWAVQKNQLTLTALRNIQDNSFHAFHTLHRAIQIAGFGGCMKLNIPAIEPHLHYLTVYQASVDRSTLLKPMQNESDLLVSQGADFKVGDRVVISDCRQIEMFTIEKKSTLHNGMQHITSHVHLSKQYQPYTEVRKLEKNTFFIEKAARTNAVNSLYWKNIRGEKMELVEGIEGLVFHYGEQGVWFEWDAFSSGIKKRHYGYAKLQNV